MQMVDRLCAFFGIMGSDDGASGVRQASRFGASTAIHRSILWFDRDDIVLCHPGKLSGLPPLSTPVLRFRHSNALARPLADSSISGILRTGRRPADLFSHMIASQFHTNLPVLYYTASFLGLVSCELLPNGQHRSAVCRKVWHK